MKSKILAVAVVAVVAVAGISAFVILSKDADSISVDASLSIMGNANNDFTIDSKDKDIVEKIINGELEFSDYPLADVNNDKSVNQEDLALLEKMINREKMEINVVCMGTDGNPYVQKINYPIQKTIVVGTNLLSTCIQVGATEFIKGYSSTGYGIAHKPVLDNAMNLKGSIFDLATDESKTKIRELDLQVGGLDAVITMPSPSYLKKSEAYISSAGIPILRIDSSDGFDSIGGALTIGYLYGKVTEGKAFNYAKKSYEVLDFIKNKVDGVPDEEKKTFMAITMGFYISETKSAYTGVCEFAGGKTVTTIEGNGSSKIEEKDEYYMNWNPNYIVSFRTLDYSINYKDIRTGKELTPQKTWEAYQKYFKDMGESYKNLVYINTSMPVICRIAYIASIFYPDFFDEGYADEVHQHFVDEYMSYLGADFDVKKDMTCVIKYSDIFS